jgi:hypothetical protein
MTRGFWPMPSAFQGAAAKIRLRAAQACLSGKPILGPNGLSVARIAYSSG